MATYMAGTLKVSNMTCRKERSSQINFGQPEALPAENRAATCCSAACLSHLLAVGLGVQGRLGQQHGVLLRTRCSRTAGVAWCPHSQSADRCIPPHLWGHAQLVEEGVVPDLRGVVGQESGVRGAPQHLKGTAKHAGSSASENRAFSMSSMLVTMPCSMG